MASIFQAEAAGMSDGLLSSSDELVVPEQYAAHADVYCEAFHRVRNAMSSGYQPRRSKPASDDQTKPAAPAKAARVKPTPTPVMPPASPAKRSMNQILDERAHLLQSV